jgi:exodeoxyribonuclease V alpha subunit
MIIAHNDQITYLMTTHISARLVWHDSCWKGKICEDPLSNTSCMVHDYIRDTRNDEIEKSNSGESFSTIKGYEPPCTGEISLFSPEPSRIMHTDPLEWRRLPNFYEDLDANSFCARPYRRMFSSEEGITWESDPDKQRERLEEYFGAIENEKSLVFFYANHGNPLVEDAGDRLLIGVARILKKGNQLYFPKTPRYKEDYPLWSRAITIAHPGQSVTIPYQEYLKNDYDASAIICKVPGSLREGFSYVSEQIADDQAVIALEAIIQTAKIVRAEGKSKEDWDSKIKWLDKILDETWGNRGAYPGAGSILKNLGMHKGTIYQKEILNELTKKGKDVADHLLKILDKKKLPEKKYKKDLEIAITQWQDLPEQRKELLKKLFLFDLTGSQVQRIANPDLRKDSEIHADVETILENPYILCEQDIGAKDSDPISFDQIDHGMLPLPNIAKKWGERPSLPQNDKRRTRALIVETLKSAALSGDTLLPFNEMLRRVRKRVTEGRECNPDRELILANKRFYKETINFDSETDNPNLALPKLRQMEIEISTTIRDLTKITPSPASKIDWKHLLEKEIGEAGKTHLNLKAEERAQKEKAEALEKLFRNSFSILTGRAGTGKTTVVKILLQGITEKEGQTDVLLLAPTGKARVRLKTLSKEETLTIHQLLNRNEWMNQETFTLRESGGSQITASTIIIDEASMIPLDLLGTLFRAINFNSVKRLIFIGDSNQLPPIGPGRPFVDIIKWLDQDEEHRIHLMSLKERARQITQSEESEALRLSDGYTAGTPTPNDDQILSDISKGYNKGDLEVHFWNTPEELYKTINEKLAEMFSVGKSEKSYIEFNASLGIPDGTDYDPENWQILSPVRMQRFGTREINRLIQKTYRKGLMENSRHNSALPRPFGNEDIVYTDKVIQIVNTPRKAWMNSNLVNGYVANGEVGYVSRTCKDKKNGDYLEIKFSTQSDRSYRYYRKQTEKNLELAYAITVHKAQGSDFNTVFLILPQKVGTLSRELLYTGLTRFKKKLILLIEKDITPLKLYRKMQHSETMLRNTNLFEPIARPEGVKQPYPEKLIHRTTTGELVRSKSEVIVANVLTELRLDYKYEEPLEVTSTDFRLPDFTIYFKGKTFYWEHLGMLNVESYKEEWTRKKSWYERNNFAKQLITSQDGPDGSIDSAIIQKIAREKILSQI